LKVRVDISSRSMLSEATIRYRSLLV